MSVLYRFWPRTKLARREALVFYIFISPWLNGRESPNHLLVRFDQLNQVVSAALDPIFNNEAKAADVLPAADAELEKTLKQIKAEYGK
ncbi:MAG: hypothetical protein N2508_15730 [Anaerolineae bacterium]|nr:hypothetical protein [Anaerolineae bacterium]